MRAMRPLDQAHIKRHNIESLLSTLERCQPVSPAELTRLTEMSTASVTRFVSALSTLGLVEATGEGGEGAHAVSLSTSPESMYTLGCHFDPRSMRLCLMDFSNRVRAVNELMLSRDDLTPQRLAQLAKQQAARLIPESADRLRGACVSVSGRMDQSNGRIGASQAFGWTNVDLATPFSQALGLPVTVENDVRSCLMWESLRLALDNVDRDCAYLYLGRAGIGFSATVGGRLVRGLNNSAGEIEEVFLGPNDCLNEHLMESSMVARARRFSPSVRSIDDILKAHRMGLTWAKLLMEDFVEHLNTVLQLIHAILDPHCLILGGDMTDVLRSVPGLLPEGRYSFGEQFEDSCAHGAAVIAMRRALHERIKDAMNLMEAEQAE